MLGWRDFAAGAVFCLALALIGVMWGKFGLAGAGAMLVAVWAAIGLYYGWWMGSDDEHDRLIVELARRLRQRRAQRLDRPES